MIDGMVMDDLPTDEQRRSMLKLLNTQQLELMLTITENKELARWITEELHKRRSES